MIKKKLTNGKVIIRDQYGIYSYTIEGFNKVALVGCKGLEMNQCDKRNFKVMVGNNIPWLNDWEEVFKSNLTRAEAKAIIRHKAREIKMWEKKHQMLHDLYYGAREKLRYRETDYCLNNQDEGWKYVNL